MNVLFLTHRLPYAPDRGDRIRAYHMLRVLSRSANVDVLSLVHDSREASRVGELRKLTSSVTLAPVSVARKLPAAGMAVLRGQPLTHALLDSPVMRRELTRVVRERKPDVVLAYCSGMARFALTPPLASLPFVLDMVDVDSMKWAELAAKSKGLKRWLYKREARRLGVFEAIATSRARVTLVVNQRERDLLSSMTRNADIRIIEIGIDIDYFAPRDPPPSAPEVVFCGVMNYEPNVEAARWLIRQVWPLVRKSVPDARLWIVGSDPSPHVIATAAQDPSVTVTGRVEDVRPYLWRAAVAVAPLFTARGVQNKVLEATAAGLPSVVTPAVFEGLPEEIRPACVPAADVEGYAAAIVALLTSTPQMRRARASSAQLDRCTWERRLSEVAPLLEAAARS